MIGIYQFCFNAFGENTYVVYDTDTRDGVIIDPGCSDEREWASLRNIIVEPNIVVRHVLVTHSHLDHVLGTGYCAREYNIGVTGSLDDQLALPTPDEQSFLFGVPCQTNPTSIVHHVHEGDRLTFGRQTIDIIDVPGHSPHGLCFYLSGAKMLFSGDVLFAGSIGRSDFGRGFGCDGRALVDGIRTKLFALPDDVAVFPGHGPQTTIGQEKTANPYVRLSSGAHPV